MFAYMNHGKDFYKRLFTLALPLFVQQTVTSSLNIIDNFIVGSLGENALAAITVANIPLKVLMLLCFGAQSGTTILVSQYWGKKDKDSISKILGVGLFVTVSVTMIFVLIVYTMPYKFMSLFGNDPEVIELSIEYIKILVIYYLFQGFVGIYNSSMTAMEMPLFSTIMVSSSTILKIFLNNALVKGMFGFKSLGIKGAGLSSLITVLIQFVCILLHMNFNSSFKVNVNYLLRPGIDMVKRYIANAGTVIMNETLWGFGSSMIVNVMSHMQNSAIILSAYSVANNIDTLTIAFSTSLSNTAAVIVGKEVGAKHDKKQVERIGWTMPTVSLIVGIFFGAALNILGRTLGSTFLFSYYNLSEASANVCLIMINIFSFVVPLKAFNDAIVVGVLRGGGDVKFAALIDLFPLWVGAVPYAALTGIILKLSITWVMLSYVVQYIIQSIMGIYRLSSGKWIKNITN